MHRIRPPAQPAEDITTRAGRMSRLPTLYPRCRVSSTSPSAVSGSDREAIREPVGATDDGETTVEVRPGKALRRPVTLAEIKADAELAGWDLIRLPRLSVVPVTETQWRRVISLAEADG